MKKLSLVVPIYGVEDYIDRFLTSLTKNLQPNIEVILVDDGSKDNCGRIIDEYAVLHSDVVQVIHKKNGGVSSTRNAGMSVAVGEYIIFPDPDDCLADDYVKTILMAAAKYNCPDVILFDHYDQKLDGSLTLKNLPCFKEGVVDREAFLREFVMDKCVTSTMWDKAIKRKLYTGVSFKEDVKVYEDALALTAVFQKINTIVYVPQVLYYYTVRDDSLSKSMDLQDAIKCFAIFKEHYEVYKNLLDNLSIYASLKFAYVVLQRIYIDESEGDAREYEDYIKNNLAAILRDSEIDLNFKKQCLFVWLGIARSYNAWKYKKS